jgi:hypothetical protein
MDVWPIVVQNHIKNTPDDMTADQRLAAWVMTRGTVAMQHFVFKHRARLNSLIDDIWVWETMEQDLKVARTSRLEALRAAAAEPCACGGRWAHHVLMSFQLNGIDIAALCHDILVACTSGRSEAVPVIVLAGARGGEGKSLFLKALLTVFGLRHVFVSPEVGNFPMVELPGKNVAFLGEWRFGSDIVSFATQCLWYDGSVMPINRPQNVPGATGHYQYQGTAPIFTTTKLADIERPRKLAEDDPATGVPKSAEASIIYIN